MTSSNSNSNSSRQHQSQVQYIVLRIPTILKDPSLKDQQVDLSQYSSQDLKTLETQDPFLYRSIPAVQTARISGRDVKNSSIKRKFDDGSASPVVSRKTRMSTESHLGALMEALLNGDEEEWLDEDQS